MNEDSEKLLFDVLLAFWKSVSYPCDDQVTQVAEVLQEPTLERAKQFGWEISWDQRNPKRIDTKSFERYENYKSAKSIQQAIDMGATIGDLKWDLERHYLK